MSYPVPVTGLVFHCIFMQFCIETPKANSVDPDWVMHSAASDLGLHCLHFAYVPEICIRSTKGFMLVIQFNYCCCCAVALFPQ